MGNGGWLAKQCRAVSTLHMPQSVRRRCPGADRRGNSLKVVYITLKRAVYFLPSFLFPDLLSDRRSETTVLDYNALVDPHLQDYVRCVSVSLHLRFAIPRRFFSRRCCLLSLRLLCVGRGSRRDPIIKLAGRLALCRLVTSLERQRGGRD